MVVVHRRLWILRVLTEDGAGRDEAYDYYSDLSVGTYGTNRSNSGRPYYEIVLDLWPECLR
jgi:hypothetical protein